MKPDDSEFLLSQLLDGQLDSERARLVRERMAKEPQLAERYRLYQKLDGALAAFAQDAPAISYDFQREGIHEKLQRQALLVGQQPPVVIQFVRRWGRALAAAAVISGLLITFFVIGHAGKHGSIDIAFERPSTARTGRMNSPVVLKEPATEGHLDVRYSASDSTTANNNDAPRRHGSVIVSADSDGTVAPTFGLDEL